MQAFSHSLAQLYDVAAQASPAQFPAEVLRLLGRWIDFDGAVLGMGEATVDPRTQLLITQAHVHGRDDRILADYAALSADDPVTGEFMRGLPRPVVVDCRRFYGDRDLPALDRFSRGHRLRHLMLFGDRPREAQAGRWLVLYRAGERGFQADDAEYLHAAWFHVSRAIAVNRATLLSGGDSHPSRAAAVLAAQGRLDVADPGFAELLRSEWPAFDGRRLPAPVLQALQQAGRYRGAQVQLDARPRHGWLVCEARRLPTLDGLSPREAAVARRFADGLSHKEIARELGVSPSTVRNQLAGVYAKLGVHDKASLARRVDGRDD